MVGFRQAAMCQEYSSRLGSGGGGLGSSANLAISWMSPPAEKARSPLPVKMTALTASSASMSVTASSSSRVSSLLRAFSTLGRFRVIIPTPSLLSTMTLRSPKTASSCRDCSR